MTELLEAALAYAERALFVVPLAWPQGAGECSCGCDDWRCWERAKHPLVALRRATCDAATIRAWWAEWPDANVGIATRKSGIVVVDLDLRPGHVDLMGDFVGRWGEEVMKTAVVMTGKGYHLYYRRASASRRLFGGKARLGAGVDVVVDGYVVAPPSVHSTMTTYSWRQIAGLKDDSIAELPTSLFRVLGRRPSPRWYVHNAPYAAADRLQLSFDMRERLRRWARKLGIQG